MTEKLKPCPHCGAEVKMTHAMGEWWIDCPCRGMRATETQAMDEWNIRTTRCYCGEPLSTCCDTCQRLWES